MVSNELRLDEHELVTRDMYDQTAEKWATTSDGMVNGHYLWQRAMETLPAFAKFAPSGDQGKQDLLEIGSGTGRDAKKFLAESYRYIGVDVSESFINIARRATAGLLPADAFRTMSVYELKYNFA